MRRGYLLLVLLVGLSPLCAAKPISIKGQLDGKPLTGNLELVQEGNRRYVQANLGGLQGRGEKVGAGLWKIVLTRGSTVGAAGRLQGKQGGKIETLTLLLVNTGDEIRAAIYRAGKRVGRVGATRKKTPPRFRQTRRGRRLVQQRETYLGEPVQREKTLTRNSLLARVPVAAWGTLRALWDFYKPGSRRLEELRGGATRAQTRELRKRLDSLPTRPWTPALIYRTARLMTSTDREGLELAFGFVVDERTIPLRQLPGIGSEVPIHDKYEHFFASAIMAHRSNGQGSFFVGWLKEVLDGARGTGYNEDDLMADAQGAEFGEGLLKGKISGR